MARSQRDYDAQPARKAAHLARVLAARARMTDAERFAHDSNVKARVRYGVPHQLIQATDLPPNDECAYCGSTEGITWDHVVPMSRGGENSAANLVAACGLCNRSKNNRTPDEWLAAGLYWRAEVAA